MIDESIRRELRRIHAEVDAKTEALARRHGARLKCGLGCADCCVDDLTVFAVEADRIQRHCGELLRERSPHPPGRCAFLGQRGECRIYAHRPYVCRTQGLPLRWLEEEAEDDWVEYRDICPLNEEGEPLEDLAENDCWTIGGIEGRLAQLQARAEDGQLRRVRLRYLFDAE